MTIQAVPTFLIPGTVTNRGVLTTAMTGTSQVCGTIDAANEQMAAVFTCPVGGSLTTLDMRTQTVSVTSGPLNFDFRLETVSNGRPTGTLWATTTNIAVSVATTDDNVWKTGTLTSAATVAQGDQMAFVIKSPAAGTFSMTWGGFSAPSVISYLLPLIVQDISPADGTYDTVISVNSPSMAVKISGTWYEIEPWLPIDSMTLTTCSSAGKEEYAQRFTVPVGIRVKGACVVLANIAAAADFTVSLWPDSASAQTDANALAQITIDGDTMGSTTADGCINVNFPSSVTLTAGTVYWIGVRNTTANALSVPIYGTIATYVDAMPGGSGGYAGNRDWAAGSANAFTTVTNNWLPFALVCDGIDLPAGSGGGLRLAGAGGLAG